MGADDEVIVNVQVVGCAGSLRLNAMSVTAASVLSVCTHINFLFLDGMLGGWRAVGLPPFPPIFLSVNTHADNVT